MSSSPGCKSCGSLCGSIFRLDRRWKNSCATQWPPLAATATDKPTGDYTIVTRDDGAKQWAYKGRPLYLWVNDKKPGDKTGDGVGGVWKIAKP